MPASTDVALATLESSPGMFPVRPVAQVTLKPPAAPAATTLMDTPLKPPDAVVLQNPSTGSATKLTSATPAATHQSTRVRKPLTWLLEEM